MTTPARVLVCTVGGSHQPIVRAITESRAEHVCFICTGPDPGTGKPGSDVQITGSGSVIKARMNDDQPSLPNIPTLCGLTPDRFETLQVPADDLDSVYVECQALFKALRQRWPAATLVADYTGGTKTMTAGLVLAALESDQVELQLVTGNRADLIRVRDGAESSGPANIEAIRLERNMQPYLAAWHRFAYSEADEGLKGLSTPKDSALRSRLNRARDLSAAFAAWDRFEHAVAQECLQVYARTLPPDCAAQLGILRSLIDANPLKQQAAKLLDLYLNARRRAVQARYDDAVARLYRLLEWTAQWTLERHCGVRTGDLPDDFAPWVTPNRQGKRQVGLNDAWRLVAEKTAGPLAAFIKTEDQHLLNHLRSRNHSILAHGFDPLGRAAWEAFDAWITEKLLPPLLEEAGALGIRKLPPQLPDRFPNSRTP